MRPLVATVILAQHQLSFRGTLHTAAGVGFRLFSATDDDSGLFLVHAASSTCQNTCTKPQNKGLRRRITHMYKSVTLDTSFSGKRSRISFPLVSRIMAISLIKNLKSHVQIKAPPKPVLAESSANVAVTGPATPTETYVLDRSYQGSSRYYSSPFNEPFAKK